jgi:solute:Na+ symporter, SSS family
MKLSALDFVAIFGYLAATLLLGLYFRRKSGKSTADYFVSGRQVSWWLAGTSMVATTFAADTPLAVTGLVFAQGISGNWLWWAFLPSGMMTVFLFARLWRRSGLLTDVEFAEMRYAGKPAAFLRGFRAVYLGLLMNCLILGWVTKAMTSIVSVTLGTSDAKSLALCIFFLMPFTGLYVALGGLWGVLWTDLFQFILKMGIVIAVAWYGVRAVGGMGALLAKLAAMRAAAGPSASDITAVLPDFHRGLFGSGMWTLPVLTFVVLLGLQWWAFWYPGAEPGGGGYIAQRIFSARDEKNGLLSVLWFNVAHYALRPWPWIIAALVAVALYPHLQNQESGYMLVATNFMPVALRGVLIAGFMAAFMSTLATQLNWGSSYLVADLYRRFIKTDQPEGHYVVVGRIVTLLLVLAAAFVAWELSTIREGWKAVLEVGAGTGGVYLLRWYWWRINAWSEITAMVVAMACTLYLNLRSPFAGQPEFIVFAKTTLFTTAITTVAWVIATFVTNPERDDILVKFYRHVRPHAAGWRRIAEMESDVPQTRDLGANLVSWLLGCAMVYATLFAIGELCFGRYALGAILFLVAAICAVLLYQRISNMTEGLPPIEPTPVLVPAGAPSAGSASASARAQQNRPVR